METTAVVLETTLMAPAKRPLDTVTATHMTAEGERQLIVIRGSETDVHALVDNTTYVIGRSDKCEITVLDASLSRQHLSLRVGQRVMEIEDLGSKNGTVLRGSKLASGARAPLGLGDSVRIGDTVLVVHPAVVGEKIVEGRQASAAPSQAEGAVIASEAMQQLSETLEQVARGQISVLLLGETGVGKEVAARTLHESSPRAGQPFVVINCPALPDSLIESELFGHEKGAFSGADSQKTGLLEQADGGTVFLDEVGELPLLMQVKLLRVLEDRKVMRVGASEPKQIDVRFVSATNRDLSALSKTGSFRSDLYFRLNGFSVDIPPLRERGADIEPLARHFIDKFATALGYQDRVELDPDALAALQDYAWPGNVRELRNIIERALLLCGGRSIATSHLHLPDAGEGAEAPASAPADELVDEVTEQRTTAPPADADLEHAVQDFERERIIEALNACAGNQTRAAKMLGISRRGLVKKLDKYGIPRPKKP